MHFPCHLHRIFGQSRLLSEPKEMPPLSEEMHQRQKPPPPQMNKIQIQTKHEVEK